MIDFEAVITGTTGYSQDQVKDYLDRITANAAENMSQAQPIEGVTVNVTSRPARVYRDVSVTFRTTYSEWEVRGFFNDHARQYDTDVKDVTVTFPEPVTVPAVASDVDGTSVGEGPARAENDTQVETGEL